MGKSILVIDTPECCAYCPMVFKVVESDVAFDSLYSCRYAPSDAGDFYLPDIASKKPDWCPLHDAPQKRDKNRYHNKYEQGHTDGWNDCLDQILNGDRN